MNNHLPINYELEKDNRLQYKQHLITLQSGGELLSKWYLHTCTSIMWYHMESLRQVWFIMKHKKHF